MIGIVEITSFNAMLYFEPGQQDMDHNVFAEGLAMELTWFMDRQDSDKAGP